MGKLTLVFDGGSRAASAAGFGSFAIVKGNQRTVTHLEFGSGMTPHEAGYDTLIMGLQTLIRQEAAGDTLLEVQSPNALIVNQVQGRWAAREPRLRARHDQAVGLLGQFASFNLTRISREQANRLLAR